jgi:hypothetical protein
MCTAVLIGRDPATSPPTLAFAWTRIRGALLVSLDRRHLLVTPWIDVSFNRPYNVGSNGRIYGTKENPMATLLSKFSHDGIFGPACC